MAQMIKFSCTTLQFYCVYCVVLKYNYCVLSYVILINYNYGKYTHV